MNKRIEIELPLASRLAEIQQTLNAPKNQRNNFGGYNYRSCEDILMAVKPLLGGLVITINDEMILVGDRIYVKATATITDGKESISTSAFAREADSKKGMDSAQVTGSTSSYARKYALNGLLLIDDNKDADHTNTHGKAEQFANAAAGKGVTPTAGVYESMSEEEQTFLKELAYQVETSTPKDAVKLLEESNLHTEEKVAIWSLLDSKTRSAIKKCQAEKEFAGQA